MTAAKLRLAQAAMGKPGTKVSELCAELSITRQTLYVMSTRTAFSGQMARSYSAECEHARLSIRSAEVGFDILLKPALKNDSRDPRRSQGRYHT